jgi:predicted transcriptional regulator YdeE/DNA-binding transcriptional MerR regulator
VLRIGDFSRLAHVTVKALRHYAELGLFKPVWIDRFTSYRYYNLDQLPQLNRILALKDLGFSLDQVTLLLDDNISPAQLQDILVSKQSELKARLLVEQKRLDVIANLLTHIQAGQVSRFVELQRSLEQTAGNASNISISKETNMQPTIVIKPAFHVVGMCYHGTNQNHEIPDMWGVFLQRTGEIERINPTLSYGVCSSPKELPEGHFEYVACVEVSAGAPVPAGMVLRSLPEMKYAVFAHRGSLEGLGKTYQKVYELGLPEAGLHPLTLGLDIEVYTEEWADGTPESILYIYVPIA